VFCLENTSSPVGLIVGVVVVVVVVIIIVVVVVVVMLRRRRSRCSRLTFHIKLLFYIARLCLLFSKVINRNGALLRYDMIQ